MLREAVKPARPSAPIKVKAPAQAPAPATVDVDLEVDIGEPPGAAQPALPPLRSGEESRPLLCVVGGQGEHVKAAALMHALAGRPELPVTLLAVLCTGVAYLMYFRLIAHIGPANAITVTFLIPAFAVLWGWLFLAEPLTAAMAVGCAVILLGTALATGVLKPPRFASLKR